MNRDDYLRLDRIAGLNAASIRDSNDVSVVAALRAAQRDALAIALRDQMKTSGPPGLWEIARDIDLSGPHGPGVALLNGLVTRHAPPTVIRQAKEQIAKLDYLGVVVDELAVGANALVRDVVAAARMHRIAEIAALDPARASALVDGGLRLSQLDDAHLQDLVEHRLLTGAQAASLGLTTSIYRLVDEDARLVEAVLNTRGGALPAAGVKTVRDLVGLDVKGWKAVMTKAAVTPPGGMDLDRYAVLVTARVEAAYPTDAIRVRLGSPNAADVAGLICAAEPALGVGAAVFDHAHLDLSGVDGRSRGKVGKAVGRLAQLVGAYRGLGLEEIVTDRGVSDKARAAQIVKRVAVFDAFRANNAGVELVYVDFAAGSADVAALNFTGIAESDRRLVLRHAKVMQRMHAITRDATDAAQLMRAGFDSAAALASTHLGDVVARTGLAEGVAAGYYDTALMTVGSTASLVGSMIDVRHGGFDHLDVANTDPRIEDYFKQIDGYEDLFGSQDYCSCELCKSIVGPAAYFVDLMHFVEEKLLDRVFTGGLGEHVLHLKTRRPDLWTLPLTCENTNTEIPQLVIVTEVLENYLAARTGFAGALSDRTAVHTAVYRDQLQSATAGFGLPFHLPLARIRTYLEHFGVGLPALVGLFGGSANQRAAAELELSAAEFALITTTKTTSVFLNQMYAQTFTFIGAGVKALDAQTLLRPMGISRDELGAVLATAFVSASGAEPVAVVGAKRSASSVQNDIEQVVGLRRSSLDRMHRFLRLWRRCSGWSIPELDVVLEQLIHAGVSTGIDAAAVRAVAQIRSLQRRFALSVEEVIVLFGGVPTRPVSPRAPGLFDRLFNLPEMVTLDGPLPMPGIRFVHPALRDDPAAVGGDHLLDRLRAATRTDSAGLFALIVGLAGPLGADLDAASEAARGFEVTAGNLALLVRHARLARLLRIAVPDLFRWVALLPGGPRTHLAGLADLQAFLDMIDWAKAAKRSVDDLAAIVGAPVVSAAVYPDAGVLAGRVVDRLCADASLMFSDTVFTLIAGVSESDSRAIVAANAGIFAVHDQQLVLTAAFGQGVGMTVPAGLAATEAQLRAVLLTHHAGTLVQSALAAEVKMPVEKVAAMAVLAGADFGGAAIVDEALGNGSLAALSAAIGRLVPVLILLGGKDISAETVGFIATNPALFAITDPGALSVVAARKIAQFRRLAGSEPAGAAVLIGVLGAHTGADHFAAADQDQLAGLLGVAPTVAMALQHTVALPADALDVLDVLLQAARVVTTIGIEGQQLALVCAQDYDVLQRGADALYAAFRAKYADEAAWQQALAPFDARLLAARRDALANFLVYAIHPEFERVEDLFRYFLIDPEVEGCFSTSRVVSAISSVQMYVHRVLMNLEQNSTGEVYVQPTLVPADEWQWRQHYRVWEANRKVFLWPENYLFPDLRDDKTPLFEELEKQLLQTDIDEQAVLDAYGAYVDGFKELAGLRISGAFQETSPDGHADTLHLFGVSPDDPPTFYYRRVQNITPQNRPAAGTVWGAWQKINVAIPVREVSPVVYNGRLHLLWVEITTLPVNEVIDAGSTFVGYSHKLAVKFSTLRLDGRWTAPQKVQLYGTDPFGGAGGGEGVIVDPLAEPEERDAFETLRSELEDFGCLDPFAVLSDLGDAQRRLLTPRYDAEIHLKARDGYTLRGAEWTQLYPEVHADGLFLAGAGYQMRCYISTFDKTASPAWSGRIDRQATVWNFQPPSPVLTTKNGTLYYGTPAFAYFDDYAFAALVADRTRLDRTLVTWPSTSTDILTRDLYVGSLATIGGARLSPINGALHDGIIDADGDLYLLQATPATAARWALRRLGTTLAERVSRELFTGGIDHLLDLNTQGFLAEAPAAIHVDPSRVDNQVNAGRLDFTGPLGTYYREMFFHIPFLIANQLNAQGNYTQAERWYHYIFDPTTAEVVVPDPGLSAAAQEARRRDRNWRYLEFRGQSVPALRTILTDASAIAAYHQDPFNPHAIARLRLSAYQKAIVMRYLDNKLDLADSLFAQFEMETVNQALMHYTTVADILGDRPAQLGPCGPNAPEPNNYEHIKPLIAAGSEFLIEAEHLVMGLGQRAASALSHTFVLDSLVSNRITTHALASPRVKAAGVFTRQDATRICPPATRSLYAAPNVAALIAAESAMSPEPGPAAPQGRSHKRLTPAELFARRAALPAQARGHTVADVRPHSRFSTADIDARGGLSGIGRLTTTDLNPAGLHQRFAERSELTTVVARSARSVDATTAVVPLTISATHGGPVPSGAVSAGPDWTQLGGRPTKRLRPHLSAELPRLRPHPHLSGRFGLSVIRQINPVFCIPLNKDLLAYWDRLEDRLWKLRNCRDITGALRKLSLFAPEIDPMALVRARAAGMSLDDALESLHGDVPPYRFSYLLDKAKAHAAAVQGFGSALQSALERRDGEQLNQLHALHQHQLAALTMKAREQERDIAANAVASLQRHRASVADRKTYFEKLVTGSLSPAEQTQRISAGVASGARMTEATLALVAGVLHMIPQLGSPFAMKYGGMETGWSMNNFATGARAVAAYADALAAISASEAGYQRRDQGWRHEVDTAADELAEIDVQIAGAQLRQDLAEHAIAVHTRTVEQAEEILSLYEERFTSVGLYGFLATTLQRLHREAYNTALSMARMAEQAYRFERGDNSALLGGSYWDSEHAGLTAGAKLVVDLQQLERRYIETNTRDLEIDQPFSLNQIDPTALITLQTTGECEFVLPELFFDIAYPGQFRRQIKSVRLTIPCVTGPYANISATLQLHESWIRPQPKPGAAGIVEVPHARAAMIATSTAQNDPGVFELSFRDERYMPFEGAGAISKWQLTLPKTFRQFDYTTISDVVLRLAYTAKYDGALRDCTEQLHADTEGTLLSALASSGLPHVISLRSAFPTAFNRLLHGPADTPVDIALLATHLPYFVSGREITVSTAKLALRLTPTAPALGGLMFTLNGAPTAAFAADPALGGLPSADVTAAFPDGFTASHTIAITQPGGLAPDNPALGDPSCLEDAWVSDVLLVFDLAVVS